MRIREKTELEFKTKRELNRVTHIKKISELRERYPELDDIENELKDAFKHNMSHPDDMIDIDELLTKRENIIKKLGIGDELEPHYDCNECRDTGYLENGEMCGCFRKTLVEEYFKLNPTGGILKSNTFENFDEMIFAQVNENDGTAIAAKMAEYKKLALKYVDEFSSNCGKSIFMYGKTGTGKTFLSGCIANSLKSKGYSVLYITAIELMNIYRDGQFAQGTDRERFETLDSYIRSCDMLVIDDLGTENDTPFSKSVLYDLINYRTSFGKPFIINSNYEVRELSKRYEDRIFSRIVGASIFLNFEGEDIRMKRRHIC